MRAFFIYLWQILRGIPKAGERAWDGIFIGVLAVETVYSTFFALELINNEIASTRGRGIAVFYIAAWAYVLASCVQRFGTRWIIHRRKKQPDMSMPLPLFLMICPRCGAPQSIFDMDAHVEEHLKQAHNSEHNGQPIAAIYREPGDTEWRHIIREDA